MCFSLAFNSWLSWACVQVLANCHERRVVHGDITPANIMSGKEKCPVTLVDFGSASLSDGVHALNLPLCLLGGSPELKNAHVRITTVTILLIIMMMIATVIIIIIMIIIMMMMMIVIVTAIKIIIIIIMIIIVILIKIILTLIIIIILILITIIIMIMILIILTRVIIIIIIITTVTVMHVGTIRTSLGVMKPQM
jgi:serine/threonine protein kinase